MRSAHFPDELVKHQGMRRVHEDAISSADDSAQIVSNQLSGAHDESQISSTCRE
jgi:hypothetical protein